MDHGLPEAAATKLDARGRYGLRELLVGIAVALVGVPFGLLLHQVTRDGPLTSLDESAAEWLHVRVVDNEAVEAFMHAVSYTGKPIFLTFAVGLPALWLLRRGAKKLFLFLVVVSLGGGAIDTVVKVAVGRPRPKFDEPIATAFGNSFPSGHSMSSLVCYGALLLVFLPLIPPARRWLAVAATALLVFAIGFSRLALGVHFVSDVLGGYVLGAAWLLGSVAAFEIWREERGRRTTEPLEEGIEPEEAKRAAHSG
ncbi:MAG TPA: phosphatase PAP2 family protein [Acidimicrobiales bacterium]|nr:phosphatase PAP2 family protein [Acidimicrobiales bacterium]